MHMHVNNILIYTVISIFVSVRLFQHMAVRLCNYDTRKHPKKPLAMKTLPEDADYLYLVKEKCKTKLINYLNPKYLLFREIYDFL